jgi:hypothetical protein
VVVEIRVGHSHKISRMSQIEKSIVVVLSVTHIRRQVQVIKPDVLRDLHPNRVTAYDISNREVADDDVFGTLDAQPNALESCASMRTCLLTKSINLFFGKPTYRRVLADDALVGAHFDSP